MQVEALAQIVNICSKTAMFLSVLYYNKDAFRFI